MALWKVSCMEDVYPWMWQRWFRHQCVAVGWRADAGYPLSGPITAKEYRVGWARARKPLQRIKIGDHILVALKENRVGRLGEVTGIAIGDDEWDPLVPPSANLRHGEMGRRILVRWDLTTGPDDREMVVSLPPGKQFSPGERRPTLS